MVVPKKYMEILSQFQRALKSEDFTEIDLIPLQDLKLAQAHLISDKSSAYYTLLLLKIQERESEALAIGKAKKPLVFFSYDTRDIELVTCINAIVQRIFNGKVRTFIALLDIKAGESSFRKMLHENLAESAIVLAICTKRSITSPWLWFESGAGFGSSLLIPVFSGVTPLQLKPPMNIFQGKDIQNRLHVEELIARIAEVTMIGVETDLTDDEFNNLAELSRNLSALSEVPERVGPEDRIAFPLPSPDMGTPMQYVIEASFPSSKYIARQRLEDYIKGSMVTIKGNQNRFSFTYPDLDIKDRSEKDVLIINQSNENHYSNEQKQVSLIKSESVTFTHWVRNFHLGKNQAKFVKADEINADAGMVYMFFVKMAKKLHFPDFNIRIRLFGIEDGQLLCGKYFEKHLHTFNAPSVGELEVTREISYARADHDFTDLMMEVWDKFQTPNGKCPVFKDSEYLSYLNELASGGAE
jgi:hypothetical protein